MTEAPSVATQPATSRTPIGGKRAALPVMLGAALGLVVALVGPGLIAAKPPNLSPSAIYERMQLDADRGDARAKEMLAAVDAYKAEMGISIDQMGPLDPGTTETRTDGLIRLRIEDYAPWGLSIRTLTELRSRTDQAAYIALRTGALRGLASASPERDLRVVVTPNRLIALDEFIANLGCVCTVTEVVVDVFVGDEWAFSSVRGIDGALNSEVADVLSAQAVEAAAIYLTGVDQDALRLTVRRISLTTTAEAARQLSDRSVVLLVDPLDDLGDPYRGRAALIEVSGAPDVFYGHALWNLGISLDATPSSPGANGGKP